MKIKKQTNGKISLATMRLIAEIDDPTVKNDPVFYHLAIVSNEPLADFLKSSGFRTIDKVFNHHIII